MNWSDAMKESADLVYREQTIAQDAIAVPRDPPTSWEPHEVWLSRVKQPRDHAALRSADNAGGLGPERPD